MAEEIKGVAAPGATFTAARDPSMQNVRNGRDRVHACNEDFRLRIRVRNISLILSYLFWHIIIGANYFKKLERN